MIRWLSIVTTGTIVVVGLLLGVGAVDNEPLREVNQSPSTYEIGLPSLGDAVAYGNGVSLSVEETVQTRNAFNETLTATPLRLQTSSGLTKTLATAEDAGTLVWAQHEKDNGRWDRDLTVHSYPTLWGASALAGKTVEAGSTVDIPIWDEGEPVWITYEIEDGRTPSTFWVNVTVDSEQIDPRARGNLGFADGPRLLMENGSIYPLEVHLSGGLYTQRTSVEPGEGSAGWRSGTLLEPPWEKNPSVEFFIPKDARGSPPQNVDTPRMEFPLSEAIGFAEENAQGLNTYLDDHPETALWGAWGYLRSIESRIGPAEYPLVTREDPAEEWVLRYESPEADEGWHVSVGLSKTSVAQQEAHSELKVYDDYAVSKGVQERLVPIQTPQASFSGVASWAPSTAGDQEIIGFHAERLSGAFHGWFDHPTWRYELMYGPISGPPAFQVSSIHVDAWTGSLDRVSGTIEFVEAIEDHGLG